MLIMAEELQNLIDRIQRDGIDKARAEAGQIVSGAKKQATELVESAGQRAEALLKKAESDAKLHTERSIKAIGQAGRDVLVAVGHGVEQLFRDLFREAAAESLTPEGLARMIVALAKGYADNGMAADSIEVLVSPDDREKLKQLCMEKYRKALGEGVEIRSDDDIIKGFKISFKDGKVYHDFTLEAIAEVMSAFLQPRLAELVREAAKKPMKENL